MTTKIKVPTVSKAALAAAIEERKLHCDPGAKKGDVALRGTTRKRVLTAALVACTPAVRKALLEAEGEALHEWIGAILGHAGCLLQGKAGYTETIRAMVESEEIEFNFDSAAPSMPGPANIKRAIELLAKAEEKAKQTIKKPDPKKAPPKKAKKPAAKKGSAKRPPTRTKTAAA